jgi:hypothetical protein
MNASIMPMSPVGAGKSLGGTTSATNASLDLDGAANTANASITLMSPAGDVELPGEDVVMGDATSSNPPSPDLPTDDEAPGWLLEMMEYLRGVVEDNAWHRLLTGFVDFEKRGPPNGVSSVFTIANLYSWFFATQQNLLVKLRPKAISDWIKSKKKTVMPTLEAGPYGKSFKDWWTAMQPGWRIKGGALSREVPWDENWQMLRKGCSLPSPTDSRWTPPGLHDSTWTPGGLQMEKTSIYNFV